MLEILEPRRARLTLTEGKYHQVRRMLAAVGAPRGLPVPHFHRLPASGQPEPGAGGMDAHPSGCAVILLFAMWIPISDAPIACFPHFEVAGESGDWIVVDKGAPLIVHPSNGKKEPNLLEGVEALLSYEIANGAALSLVNRLDRETSGLTLIAKNKAAARELGRAMQRRRMHKEYLAIVQGRPEWAETTWRRPHPETGGRRGKPHLGQAGRSPRREGMRHRFPDGTDVEHAPRPAGPGSGAFRKPDACTRYACIWRTSATLFWETRFTAPLKPAIWNTSSTAGAGSWKNGCSCRAMRCMPAGWSSRLMKKFHRGSPAAGRHAATA